MVIHAHDSHNSTSSYICQVVPRSPIVGAQFKLKRKLMEEDDREL